MKTVDVIFCSETDISKPNVDRPPSTNELLLVDKTNGEFEVFAIDGIGEPKDMSKVVTISVGSSDKDTIRAEEPTGMTFKLSRVQNSLPDKPVVITVIATWVDARGYGPLRFDFLARATDDGIDIAPADDRLCCGIDIRPHSAEEAPASLIRRKVNEFKDRKRRDKEAREAKLKPRPAPLPPVEKSGPPHNPPHRSTQHAPAVIHHGKHQDDADKDKEHPHLPTHSHKIEDV